MPPVKPKRNYNCTQSELYVICRIGWNNCKEHLSEFSSHKTFYTPSYVTKALRSIAVAMDLPDENQRDSVENNLHDELVQAGNKCLLQWRVLSSYISSSFSQEFVSMKSDAAGKSKYKLAQNHNWKELQAMMVMGSKFIESSHAALVSGGMTVYFPSEFNAPLLPFSDLFIKYKSKRMDNGSSTLEKIQANNELYKKLQAMLRDGQLIFHRDPARYKKFVFTNIKKLVTHGDSTGVPASSLVVKPVKAKVSGNPLRKFRRALLQKAGSYLAMF